MEDPKIWTDPDNITHLRSKNYNWNIDNNSGYFERWGTTKEENPLFSEYGPEILDLEISTCCDVGSYNGKPNDHCRYCYKNNINVGKNLSLDTFKKILEVVNPYGNLKQIAFGLGAAGCENEFLWDMCEYASSHGITPNGTVANINRDTAKKIAKYFGAVAVSFHSNFNNPFNLLADQIEMLAQEKMSQINIHFMLSKETVDDLKDLVLMVQNDPRFEKLNAIVLLSLKKAGRAKLNNYQSLSYPEFENIGKFMLSQGISFGMDSCSGVSFCRVIDSLPKQIDQKNKDNLKEMIEPCESGLFSYFIDINAIGYPCSFSTSSESGYDILKSTPEQFIQYWNYNPWRLKLLQKNRSCPIYSIHPEEVKKTESTT